MIRWTVGWIEKRDERMDEKVGELHIYSAKMFYRTIALRPTVLRHRLLVVST